MTELTLEDFEALEPEVRTIPQGLIKWYENPARCQDGYKGRRCNSPTFIKIFGIPKCMIHAVRQADNIISSLTKQLESLEVKPDYTFSLETSTEMGIE